MPHIFISYAKKDTRKLAFDLADRLSAIENLTVWVDRSLRYGRAWEIEIERQIDSCDTMIVLLSPDVDRHNEGKPESYVLKEISFAQQAEKNIIPVIVTSIRVPLSLILSHYIDFTIEDLTLDDLMQALCDELEVEYVADEVVPVPEKARPKPPAPKPKDPLEIAYEEARNFKGTKNSDWTPVIRTFRVRGIEFEMCLVPPGSFIMGNDDGYDDEKPAHPQIISEPYWIGLHPVTNDQWRKAVEMSKGTVQAPMRADWYKEIRKNNHPVVGVTWDQCQDLAMWLSEQTAIYEWRLPTECEWEYAARGLDNLIYPFGNELHSDHIVYEENINSGTATVGGRPKGASWVGAQDMCGNVWEWTLSLYGRYPYKVGQGRENMASRDARVLRGGAFFYYRLNATASYRNFDLPNLDLSGFGVRLLCAPK